MPLTLIHKIEPKGVVHHIIFEVNQDVESFCTQEDCPYWNDHQKDCDSTEILELDYDKLVKLLEDRGLKPKPRPAK